MTEAERYLRKARESLASAKADARARRYNSAANRAYYAAFQAAVAALIHYRIRSETSNWEHRFVSAEFSGKLIRRRKVFARVHGNTLPELFELRIEADYRSGNVPSGGSSSALRDAQAFVKAVTARLEETSTKETPAPYEEVMRIKQAKSPEAYVEDAKHTILSHYPDVEFKVHRRGDRDFTLEVYGDYPDMWAVRRCLGYMPIDTLVDHDVWIVVLGLDRHPSDN